MREVVFIKENQEKWKSFEVLLANSGRVEADRLSDLYVQLINDLAYAKTYYPNSSVYEYLNDLAAKVHFLIYQNKREDSKRIVSFWKKELPEVMFRVRKELLVSFLVFLISFLIGWLSTVYDDSFVRLILGDGYVNMTIENIDKGDPMAVYKEEKEMNMFVGITLNNIMVSFYAFVLGLFFMLGTVYLLINNGIMLGSFLGFFYEKGVLTEALRTVWIHGTLEISAIVIAGCAGIVLGKGFLFPETYTRLEAFKRNAKLALKVIVGLVPIFVVAGFLESFVTRYTEMPLWLSLMIIFGSLAFVLYYFVILPIKIYSNGRMDRVEKRT